MARSGKLPHNQTESWRSDSGLSDGSNEKVDLTGGYYDAGDNLKFGLPIAFTTTMLSWSVMTFADHLPDEKGRAREAVRWGTDYLLKACSDLPHALYVQVGEPKKDHNCWERPEDMDTPRTAYKVTPSHPGSEVAAETAAALASASVVFDKYDPHYSKKLLDAAKKAFKFADEHRGNYSDSLPSVVCPFYCSYNGYRDELLWGAAWLFKATHDRSYLDFAQSLEIDDGCDEFSWNVKIPGARVLLSRDPHVGNDNDIIAGFREQADDFICSILPESPNLSVKYTPGGLMYKNNGSNLQYVTSAAFLLSTYAKYMKFSGRTFSCGSLEVDHALLRKHVKKQVDYILGDNPAGMSYMVGFGEKFPQRLHHRGSSLPSIKEHKQAIGCKEGFEYFNRDSPNPNILTGAIVGGPDEFDEFDDNRGNFAQLEPTTYINAPLIAPLSYLAYKFR
ncbi:hypothetical protein ACLOJK_014188 [Asimina triloba]